MVMYANIWSGKKACSKHYGGKGHLANGPFSGVRGRLLKVAGLACRESPAYFGTGPEALTRRSGVRLSTSLGSVANVKREKRHRPQRGLFLSCHLLLLAAPVIPLHTAELKKGRGAWHQVTTVVAQVPPLLQPLLKSRVSILIYIFWRDKLKMNIS